MNDPACGHSEGSMATIGILGFVLFTHVYAKEDLSGHSDCPGSDVPLFVSCGMSSLPGVHIPAWVTRFLQWLCFSVSLYHKGSQGWH